MLFGLGIELIEVFQCCLFLVEVTDLFQCCLFWVKVTDLFQCCLFCDSFVSSLLLVPTDTFWAHTRIHHTAVRMCVSLKSVLFLSHFSFLPDTAGIQHTPTAIRSVQYFHISTFNCCLTVVLSVWKRVYPRNFAHVLYCHLN